jgi:glycosyltransferase involved in cell wall biosynthesis
MQILSSLGVFHSLKLAKELEKLTDLIFFHGRFNKSLKSCKTIPLYYIQKINRNFASELFDYIVSRKVRKLKPSTVHCFASYGLRTFGQTKGLKIVDIGSLHPRYNNEQELTYLQKKQINEFEVADKILVPSTLARESILLYQPYLKSKIRVIPYGVSKPLAKKQRTNKKFRFLFIGGNPIIKRLDWVLKAFKELDDKETELYIVGKTGYSSRDANIKTIPKLVGVELSELYFNSDVLILPSISEGFGMVVTEAMAHGVVPIVSENVGAKDFITKNNGFVIKTYEELLKAMEKAKSIDLTPMKREAEKVSEYSWKDYAQKVLEEYE